jgi:hypothetical protein
MSENIHVDIEIAKSAISLDSKGCVVIKNKDLSEKIQKQVLNTTIRDSTNGVCIPVTDIGCPCKLW